MGEDGVERMVYLGHADRRWLGDHGFHGWAPMVTEEGGLGKGI
jgi:hypothetical protein